MLDITITPLRDTSTDRGMEDHRRSLSPRASGMDVGIPPGLGWAGTHQYPVMREVLAVVALGRKVRYIEV